MSTLPPKADIDQHGLDVRFVPKADICSASQNVARLRRQLEKEPDEFTRSRLLKLLLLEAEKSRLTRQHLDRIDCHMAET